MISSVDNNDITRIREPNSWNILFRGNKNTPKTDYAILDPNAVNETFRINTFVKPPPSPRKLHAAKIPSTFLSSTDIVKKMMSTDYSLWATDPNFGIPRLDAEGKIEYVVDPVTGKKVMKTYNFLDILNNAALAKTQIKKLTEQYRSGLGNKQDIENQIAVLGMGALDNIMAATDPRDMQTQWDTFISMPLIDSAGSLQLVAVFNDILVYENSGRRSRLPFNRTMKKQQILTDVWLLRHMANFFDNDAKAFRQWATEILNSPTEDVPITLITYQVYEQHKRGAIIGQQYAPMGHRRDSSPRRGGPSSMDISGISGVSPVRHMGPGWSPMNISGMKTPSPKKKSGPIVSNLPSFGIPSHPSPIKKSRSLDDVDADELKQALLQSLVPLGDDDEDDDDDDEMIGPSRIQFGQYASKPVPSESASEDIDLSHRPSTFSYVPPSPKQRKRKPKKPKRNVPLRQQRIDFTDVGGSSDLQDKIRAIADKYVSDGGIRARPSSYFANRIGELWSFVPDTTISLADNWIEIEQAIGTASHNWHLVHGTQPDTVPLFVDYNYYYSTLDRDYIKQLADRFVGVYHFYSFENLWQQHPWIQLDLNQWGDDIMNDLWHKINAIGKKPKSPKKPKPPDDRSERKDEFDDEDDDDEDDHHREEKQDELPKQEYQPPPKQSQRKQMHTELTPLIEKPEQPDYALDIPVNTVPPNLRFSDQNYRPDKPPTTFDFKSQGTPSIQSDIWRHMFRDPNYKRDKPPEPEPMEADEEEKFNLQVQYRSFQGARLSPISRKLQQKRRKGRKQHISTVLDIKKKEISEQQAEERLRYQSTQATDNILDDIESVAQRLQREQDEAEELEDEAQRLAVELQARKALSIGQKRKDRPQDEEGDPTLPLPAFATPERKKKPPPPKQAEPEKRGQKRKRPYYHPSPAKKLARDVNEDMDFMNKLDDYVKHPAHWEEWMADDLEWYQKLTRSDKYTSDIHDRFWTYVWRKINAWALKFEIDHPLRMDSTRFKKADFLLGGRTVKSHEIKYREYLRYSVGFETPLRLQHLWNDFMQLQDKAKAGDLIFVPGADDEKKENENDPNEPEDEPESANNINYKQMQEYGGLIALYSQSQAKRTRDVLPLKPLEKKWKRVPHAKINMLTDNLKDAYAKIGKEYHKYLKQKTPIDAEHDYKPVYKTYASLYSHPINTSDKNKIRILEDERFIGQYFYKDFKKLWSNHYNIRLNINQWGDDVMNDLKAAIAAKGKKK